MSSSSFARRAARALAVAVVLLLAAGAPSASAATVFVDDDHAQCPAAGFRAISPALARVPAGSTIFVCPGTYVEQLRMATPGVSVVGQTGDPADVVLRPPDPSIPPFAPVGPMVEMRAPSTRLSAVTLKGPWPRSVGCQVPNLGLNPGWGIGVLVANGPVRFAEASVIEHVALRQIVSANCDRAAVGVQIGTGGGPLRARAIVRNSLWTGYGNAVAISDDSQATIVDNVLRNTLGLAGEGKVAAGIVATRATVDIERNDVSGFQARDADAVIVSRGVVLGPRGRGAGPEGRGIVAENNIHDNLYGLLVNTLGLVVSNNAVHDNQEIGIEAAATSSGNRFLHNVALHDVLTLSATDCSDSSIGGGTAGTANTWIDNIGSVASPAEICTGGPPPPA